jgi:hypothetical protein
LARRLITQGRLVDIGGDDVVRRNANLPEQVETARTGAGEDQDGGPSAYITSGIDTENQCSLFRIPLFYLNR